MSFALLSIPTFNNSIEKLCKKKQYGYDGCRKEIYKILNHKSIDEVFLLGYILRSIGDVRISKIRLPDSKHHISAVNGYRLILCCNQKENHVVLFNIYPKRGPFGQITQSKDDLIHQLKEYSVLLKSGLLTRLDLKHELAIIPHY